jgi:hypothetical protein
LHSERQKEHIIEEERKKERKKDTKKDFNPFTKRCDQCNTRGTFLRSTQEHTIRQAKFFGNEARPEAYLK